MTPEELLSTPEFKLPHDPSLEAVRLLQNGECFKATNLLLANVDNADCRLQLAEIAFKNNKFKEGFDIVKDDETENALLAKAAFKEALGEPDKAVAFLEQAAGLNDDLVPMLAARLTKMDCSDKVIALLEGRSDLQEASLLDLGKAYVAHSELCKARDILEAMVSRDRHNLHAILLMESLSKDASSLLMHAPFLELALTSLSTNKDDAPHIHHVLGRIYEDLHQPSRAFKHYVACADIENDPESYFDGTSVVDAVCSTYTKDFMDERQHPEPVACPLIFIVGMPRSGTTLTEQILISHPDISTEGETTNAGEAMHKILSKSVTLESPADAMAMYKEIVGAIPTKLTIDKMPGNYRFLGALHILFPKAKFINVRRDRLNNCFSLYTTQFLNGHEYSNDFKNIAHEYGLYERSMTLWHDLLPDDCLIDVNYEDLVSDMKGQATRLLQFLGLDWVDSCNDFHKLKRDVKTASLAQVVHPIYKSSVDRAEKFGDLLDPLKRYLDELH